MPIVKVTNKIIIKKNIIPEVIRNIKELDNFVTRVGFPQGGTIGSPVNATGSKKAVDKMSEMVQIAFKLEFGPIGRKRKKWPFMTQAFLEGNDKIKKLVNQIYPRVLDGSLDAFRALSILGELHSDQIRMKITDLRTPALEQETIDRKKSSNPLIDSGQMRQSVGHIEGKR